MSVVNHIPRVSLTHAPTPLEFAPRLSELLGIELWIKRDDCTGLGGGGNKTRKLEFLLADAQMKGADTIITLGGIQSNHARQTAAAAAKLGFDCELVLQDVKGTPKQDYFNNGNVLLSKLFGANIHKLNDDQDCEVYAKERLIQLRAEGKKPYLIPVGGSNSIGSLGYVRCAQELVSQISSQKLGIKQIVLATGSAGTQAGLLAGLIAEEQLIPVLGINVSRPEREQNELVKSLLKEVLQKIGFDTELADQSVQSNGEYYGEGYGIVTEQMIEAVSLAAQLEGLLLDPVYSGKAMAGLIDLCRSGKITKGSQVVFLHTGGSSALFAYQIAFDTQIRRTLNPQVLIS